MSFAAYRLPLQSHAMVNRRHDEPEVIESIDELNGREGFVIAPFAPDSKCPILLLGAEWEAVDTDTLCTDEEALSATGDNSAETRKHYHTDFRNFHAQLQEGRFSKIVLARSLKINVDKTPDPMALFARACRMYPRMFVALFSTSISGTWLVATPEILLSGTGGEMSTMALAGTMRLTGKQLLFDTPKADAATRQSIVWSEKNRREQHYVETYITECIEHFADDFSKTAPYTTRAGNLVHLRTDIRFRMNDVSRLGDVLEALHPTPAVCGIPKHLAQEFIIGNESVPRRYYSGFSGPISPHADTHLYVSLRCMQIAGTEARLYAGGGLLKESTEEAEWEETEAKTEAMRSLLTSGTSTEKQSEEQGETR